MFGAYEPTIWNLQWTSKTKILAVVVSGYHRQVIAGISQATPTLNSTYDNKGPCRYFYGPEKEQMATAHEISRRVFNKPIGTWYAAKEGTVFVGTLPAKNDKLAYQILKVLRAP